MPCKYTPLRRPVFALEKESAQVVAVSVQKLRCFLYTTREDPALRKGAKETDHAFPLSLLALCEKIIRIPAGQAGSSF
jgi:hypothetical protein